MISPVVLWSDVLIWRADGGDRRLGWLSRRNPLLRAAWRASAGNGGNGGGDGAGVLRLVGLLDSLHYRPRLEAAGRAAPAARKLRSTPSKCCRCSTAC
jgi:peptide/nickel transport system permease protein